MADFEKALAEAIEADEAALGVHAHHESKYSDAELALAYYSNYVKKLESAVKSRDHNVTHLYITLKTELKKIGESLAKDGLLDSRHVLKL